MPRVTRLVPGSLVFAVLRPVACGLGLVALSVLLGACDLQVEVSATMHDDEPAASSTTEPEPDRGSSEETTGSEAPEEAASSSTGDELESTSEDGSSSTGEPLLPDGAECDETLGPDAGDRCVSGVCGLGVCQPAAPSPSEDATCADGGGGCNPGTACVVFESGVSCVPTGPDAEDGTVAPNDSPAGDITVTDLDMWDVVGPLAPGSYVVKLKASSYGELTVLDSGSGAVLSTPEQAIVPGADDIESGFADYPLTIGPDGAAGIVIAVSGTKPDALPYYFYLTGP